MQNFSAVPRNALQMWLQVIPFLAWQARKDAVPGDAIVHLAPDNLSPLKPTEPTFCLRLRRAVEQTGSQQFDSSVIGISQALRGRARRTKFGGPAHRNTFNCAGVSYDACPLLSVTNGTSAGDGFVCSVFRLSPNFRKAGRNSVAVLCSP